MARQAALSVDSLAALGTEKLARLVLDGIERDAAFKRVVTAALAAAKGPKAVAALVDKRLAGLERARGFVDWDKTKAFAADLDATVATIATELGSADPPLAVASLLRFLATGESVFARADDDQGRVAAVYDAAIERMGPLAAALAPEARSALPERITTALGRDTGSLLPRLIQAVAPHLDESALAQWDMRLTETVDAASPARGREQNGLAISRRHAVLAARQVIALARLDIDGFAALEETKHSNLQDSVAIAELFLTANRPAEALTWVRKQQGRGIKYMSAAGEAVYDLGLLPRVSLEARILDALGDGEAAQALRWTTFEATLDAEILRDYIGRLGEFEEFDALDRAFAHAGAARHIHQALDFFVAWPHPQRAAALVIDRRGAWNGRVYHVLVPAAEMLENAQPVAAGLLYRILVQTILDHAQSKAYGHGARYLAKLDELATELDASGIPDVPNHAEFRAALAKKHGRKAAFWTQVKER